MAIARTDVFYQSGILENKIQCDYHLLSNPLYGTVVTRWIAAVLVHSLYTICATQISTSRAILKIKVVKTITRKKEKVGSKSTKIRYQTILRINLDGTKVQRLYNYLMRLDHQLCHTKQEYNFSVRPKAVLLFLIYTRI